MSVLSPRPAAPSPSVKWFAAFLLVQLAVLEGSLGVSPFVLYLSAAALAAFAFAVGVLLYPWLVVPVIVLSTALDATGRLVQGTGGKFNLTGFHLAFVLLGIALGANTFLRRRTVFPAFELRAPLGCLLAAIAVSLTYSPNQPEATIGFVRIAALVVFVYMVELMLDSRRAVALVIWSMLPISAAGAVWGAYQVITGRFHLPVDVVQALGGIVPRATASFNNPNVFATFLMSAAVPMVSVLVNYRMRWWQRGLFAAAIAISMGGILASFSRSTWLATMTAIVVLLWLSGKLRYLFVLGIVGAVAVLVLREFVPFAAYIAERFLSIFRFVEEYGQVGSTSGTARVLLVIAGLKMFLDHPLLGVGWRGFPELFPKYAPPGFPYWSRVNESHTVVTTVLAELGLVGFLAFAWFVVRVVRRGYAALPGMQDPYLRAVLIGVLATFVGFQVSQSFNGDIANNTFWFYTGMLFAVIRLDEKLRAEASPAAREPSPVRPESA